jgi:signal transduction histidine kinase
MQGRDVTEQVAGEERTLAYQQRLKELAAELIATEERERHELAVALHDYVSQPLAVTRMALQSVAADQVAPSVDLLRALSLVDEATRETRGLTTELAPQILYELGLQAALHSLAEEMNVRYGLLVEVNGTLDDTGIGELERAALYRATREVLLNVVKHAHVRHAQLSMTESREEICVIVSDQGTGFAAEDLEERQGGYGLFSIRERLPLLGGHMILESEPSKGTMVYFSVRRSEPLPLDSEPARLDPPA